MLKLTYILFEMKKHNENKDSSSDYFKETSLFKFICFLRE